MTHPNTDRKRYQDGSEFNVKVGQFYLTIYNRIRRYPALSFTGNFDRSHRTHDHHPPNASILLDDESISENKKRVVACQTTNPTLQYPVHYPNTGWPYLNSTALISKISYILFVIKN